MLGAWGFTMLTGRGAILVIGGMLISSVPLRRLVAPARAIARPTAGSRVCSGYGGIVGGTTGAGIILLSLLMAVGLQGAAVIATDAAISIGIGIIKIAVFGIAGAVDAEGDRDRAADRLRGVPGRVFRQGAGRPPAAAHAHRDPRRGGDRRRRDDGVNAFVR